MSWKPALEEIEGRRERARQMGGEERVARHVAAGRLPVRERIDRMLDPGSFREVGSIASRVEYEEDGSIKSFTPANFVTGRGSLAGRPVVIGTGPGELTVRNDGWGTAYNLSAGGIILPRLEPGETATVDWHDSQLRYERILRNPERDVDADGVLLLEVGTPLPDVTSQPVPAISPLAVFAVLGLAARSRIIRA